MTGTPVVRPGSATGGGAGAQRLTLVIASLEVGGAQRIMAILANEWARRGRAVTLLTLYDTPPFFELHPAVELLPLGIAGASSGQLRAVQNNLARARRLRAALHASAPDVIISFMDHTNVLTLVATIGLRVPVIVCQHNDPRGMAIGPIWTTLRRLTYPRAERVVALSAGALSYFPAAVRARGVVMPNPVVPPGPAPAPPGAPGPPVLIAVGRLSREKGFDLLLRAFALVAARHPGWRLEIWGDGPERAALEALGDQLALGGLARLMGQTRHPDAELRRAALFALPSRTEGFPTALGEAMACGLPVVSFDCPSGPREIVRDGVDGVLVPPADVDALAAALDRLMGDAAERRRLAARAPEVLERFGLERIMARWEALLGDVVAPGGPAAREGAAMAEGAGGLAGSWELLRCPACGGALRRADGECTCANDACGRRYPIVGGVPILIDERRSVFSIESFVRQRVTTVDYTSRRGRLKGRLKRALPDITAHPRTEGNYRRFVALLRGLAPRPRVLVLGGGIAGEGMAPLLAAGAEIVESDVAFGPRTALICDAHDIPFRDGSFDGVIAQAVLEHVVDPHRCVAEIHRVLRPDGLVYAEIPFMQQVHAGAYDFTRFTHLGQRRLFRRFAELASGPTAGPGTALAWSYYYLLLSAVRGPGPRAVAKVVGRLAFAPLKYLDRLLMDTPGGLDAASGYYFLGRRDERALPDRQLLERYRGGQ